MEKTVFRLVEQHKDRWSSFGVGTGIVRISDRLSSKQLGKYDLFKGFDEKFLLRISPDVSVAWWKKGSVLFEEGSYIDLAFFVVEGEVAVHLTKQEGQAASEPIFDTTRIGPMEIPTVLEDDPVIPVGETVYYTRTHLQHAHHPTFLSTLDVDLPQGDVMRLGPGEIFGEIGALNGWPQSVTAQTVADCVLLQVRLPALRRMKEKSQEFKERIDELYRKRALLGQLKASPLFRSCSNDFLRRLAKRVELVSCRPGQVVVDEEAPADALFLVRSGFMKLSQQMGERPRVLSYVSKGMTFGETHLLAPGARSWNFTVSSVGYSELVRIPRDDFELIVKDYPQVEAKLWEQTASRIKESGVSKSEPKHSEFLEFALEKGLVEGNSILVIDLNTCTRCDDCVRACADTHNGIPRFIREGDRYANLLITKSCYHCEDPVCLIGCPTGAIRRANVGDVVEINEDICIGCGHCAENCPYDAIVMEDTQTRWGADAMPKSLRGQDRFMASKCDLCHTSKRGPACVRSCPQGCAYRVESLEEFKRLLAPD